jgi:hypothetical protein
MGVKNDSSLMPKRHKRGWRRHCSPPDQWAIVMEKVKETMDYTIAQMVATMLDAGPPEPPRLNRFNRVYRA